MATVELTSENFEETITNNDIVVIDFWAGWCGPCRSFSPIYERVSGEYPNIVFGKVNTEEQQKLATYFQIRSIPTLLIFREEIMIYAQPGSLAESALKNIMEKVKELDMDVVRQEIKKQQENHS